jgi:hypothetical protein
LPTLVHTEFGITREHPLEGAGRALAFAGILVSTASPALGVFFFLAGVVIALLGAFA